MMYRKSSLVSLALVAGLAAQANATPINDTGCCDEKSLQEILNDITVGGDSSVDVHNDQLAQDRYWQINGSGGSISTFVMEITAGASSQSIGIYDRNDPTNTVELFDGAAGPGDQRNMSILSDGTVIVGDTQPGGSGPQVLGNFAGNNFGFYLNSGNTYYTDEALNGGVDKFVTYQGGWGDTIQIDPFSAGNWGADEYIFGAEDGGDDDFQDAVFLVESITPVPEPGALSLLGLGLAGLGFSASRRRKTA